MMTFPPEIPSNMVWGLNEMDELSARLPQSLILWNSYMPALVQVFPAKTPASRHTVQELVCVT